MCWVEGEWIDDINGSRIEKETTRKREKTIVRVHLVWKVEEEEWERRKIYLIETEKDSLEEKTETEK